MELIRLGITVILAAMMSLHPFAQVGKSIPTRLVFNHVTVIDMTDSPPMLEMTVIVVGNRIESIGKTGKIRTPRSARIIDAQGKYMIPGLWDMHIHSGDYEKGKKYFPRLLGMGVTGVRDMGTSIEDVLRLRQEIAQGKLVGPRMVVCGPLLVGELPSKFPPMPLIFSVKTPTEARQAVRSLKARGVDFIKIESSISREEYFALADEAKHQHVEFAGHLPPFITAKEASDARQRSIEHLGGEQYGVLLACSSREIGLHSKVEELMKSQLKSLLGNEKVDETVFYRAGLTKPLLDSYSDQIANTLFLRFLRNETWQTPTMIALKGLWDRSDLQDEDVRYGEEMKKKELQILKAMHESGVGLLAGTDGPPDRINLHDELAMFVRAGLTPRDALKAATINPAKYFRKQNLFGTIGKGKIADLVLLEANPLEDIGNAKKVSAVVANGQYFSKESLQKLMDDINGKGNKKNPE